MDLIDKVELINSLKVLAKFEDATRASVILGIIETVKRQQTIDAVPVMHGHWIIDGHHRICSVCDNYNCLTDRENDKIADDFCPHCGAKMDEEITDES